MPAGSRSSDSAVVNPSVAEEVRQCDQYCGGISEISKEGTKSLQGRVL